MTPSEFEDYLSHLTDEQYDTLIQERITRLNLEQQTIVQAREVARKERFKIIQKLSDPNADEETHHMVLNALRDGDSDNCEHWRPYCKHCIACGEIDGLMFPELFDKDGTRLDESEDD